MKYIAKVDYACDAIKSKGAWFIIESEEPIKVGSIPLNLAPLPDPNCRLYLGRQSCDESNCLDQKILEILPFSEENLALCSKRLGARAQ